MNVIDLDKLENLKPDSQGWVAACPACRLENLDMRGGNHLRVYRSGAFGCVLNKGCKTHNSLILQLVGTESTGEVVFTPREEKIEAPEPTWDLSILNGLVKDYSYFESRGISAETQDLFKIGIGTKCYYYNHAVVPILNQKRDRITGFSGRLINYTDWHKENKIAKWKHKNKSKFFVWPLYPQEIRKSDSVILVESPGCVLWLWEQGIKNVLCLFGVNISSKVIGYLISLNPSRILIATNNELGSSNGGVGNKKAIALQKTLTNFFSEERVSVALPDLKDFGDYHNLSENSEIRFDKWRGRWHV
jgi:hypothetical protein